VKPHAHNHVYFAARHVVKFCARLLSLVSKLFRLTR